MTHHTRLHLVTKAHATTRTFIVGLALTAACADDSLTTGPQADLRPGEAAHFAAAPKGDAGIVVTRTVTYRPRDAHAKAPTRITASYTLPFTGDAPAAVSWPVTKGASDTLPTYQRMTLGTISVPARAASEVCSNGKEWKSEDKGANGSSVKAEGRDDLPYSRLDVLQDGRVIGTYTSHWKRLRDRWILTAREFETADKSIVEKIDIDHRAALSKSKPLPEAHCDAARANMIAGTELVAATAPHLTAVKRIPCDTGAAAVIRRANDFLNDLGDDTSYDSPEPCYAKRLAIYKSESLLAGAATTMAIACSGIVIPLVGVPMAITCAAATAAYIAQTIDLAIAHVNYTDCLEEQERLRRTTPPPGASPPPSGGPVIPPTDTPTQHCHTVTGWQTVTWSDGTEVTINEIGEECSYY